MIFVIDLHIEGRLLGRYGNIIPKLHSSSKQFSGGDVTKFGLSIEPRENPRILLNVASQRTIDDLGISN